MMLMSRQNHRLVLTVGLLLSCSAVAVADPTLRALIPPTSTSADPDDDAQQYAVPTARDRIGRIIAPVMINGHGPFRFLIDTGSNRTVLARSALAKLGLTADPDASVTVSGVSGTELAPTVRIEQLDAGDLHFLDMDLPVLGGPVFSGLDGILGMDGFDDMKVSADFIKDRITIARSLGKRSWMAYTILKVQFLSERLLMIDARVGRIPVRAIIDTGGTHTLGNPALLNALIRAHRKDGKSGEAQLVDVTGNLQAALAAGVPPVTLGDATIKGLKVTFGSFRVFESWGLDQVPALLIGMDVLGTLRGISIDYKRKEVILQPSVEPPQMISRKWFSLTE